MQQETQTPNFDHALTVLRWAADLPTHPELATTPPKRPTPAELRAIPVVELRKELDRLLCSKNPDEGLEALHQMGVLDAWVPEVAAMVGFGDGEWRHKDVWKHTKQVVRQAVPRVAVRWGALLHDIGKPKTRSIEPNGEVHFFGHAEVGAAMFRKRISRRLGFDSELHERIHFLILYHLRASQYDGSWTDSAVRRFYKEMGEGLIDLLDLSRADITTKRPARKKRGLRSISDLGARIRKVQSADSKVPPLPKGLGTAIMKEFGVPPSKQLGDIRNRLEELCNAGEVKPEQDMAYYLAYLRDNAEAFEL